MVGLGFCFTVVEKMAKVFIGNQSKSVVARGYFILGVL